MYLWLAGQLPENVFATLVQMIAGVLAGYPVWGTQTTSGQEKYCLCERVCYGIEARHNITCSH